MFKTVAEYKAAEAAAIAGLVGKEKKAAQTAFYNAHKTAIRAVMDAEARARNEVRGEARAALCNKAKAAAAAKGLEVFFTANTGYVKGSSWDEVLLVRGNTFAVKDTLKAHGAVWNGPAKAWVFADTDSFFQAIAAI